MADWFEQPEAEVLAGLDSGRQGIDSGQAEQRLKEYGENVLEEDGSSGGRYFLRSLRTFWSLS